MCLGYSALGTRCRGLASNGRYLNRLNHAPRCRASSFLLLLSVLRSPNPELLEPELRNPSPPSFYYLASTVLQAPFGFLTEGCEAKGTWFGISVYQVLRCPLAAVVAVGLAHDYRPSVGLTRPHRFSFKSSALHSDENQLRISLVFIWSRLPVLILISHLSSVISSSTN